MEGEIEEKEKEVCSITRPYWPPFEPERVGDEIEYGHKGDSHERSCYQVDESVSA